jgi:hypothetical protein
MFSGGASKSGAHRMSRRRSRTRQRPEATCSICRRRERDRYTICPQCERAFFEVGLDREIPPLLKRAREIQKEQGIGIDYAIRVATGRYSLEDAREQDRRRKQGRSDLSRKAREIAEKHNIGIGFARNVVTGRYSLAVAKKQDRLKKLEGDGKSLDAFSVGRRLPGSFGANH